MVAKTSLSISQLRNNIDDYNGGIEVLYIKGLRDLHIKN